MTFYYESYTTQAEKSNDYQTPPTCERYNTQMEYPSKQGYFERWK